VRAVARLFWTHCTALPLQRWLGAIALATLPLAMPALSPSSRAFAVIPLITLVCYSIATTFASAYLLRAMSAPSANRFLPHFRARSLAAFLGVMVLVSVPWLFVYAVAVAQPPHASLLLVPFFLLTVIVAISFFPRGGVAVVLLGGLVMRLVGHVTDWQPSPFATEIGVVTALGLWLAMWLAFSIWYLRARRIPPHSPTFRAWFSGSRQAEWSAVFDRETAAAVNMYGDDPKRMRRIAMTLLLCMVGAVASCSTVVRGARAAFSSGFFSYGLLSVPAALIAAYANRYARRTRLLWLTRGLSRLELFAATEKWIWRSAAPISVAASVLFGAVFAFSYGVPTETIARAVACGVASDVLGVYVGLAHVRSSRTFDVAQLAVFLILSTGAWTLLADPADNGVLTAAVLVQVAAALALRALALRNWRRIDWLEFRPARIPHQALRAER